MKNKANVKGNFKSPYANINLSLSVIEFKEESLNYIYCPSLDILVYGNTISEARNSLSIHISEFIDYTTKKKTLEKVLEKMGWEIGRRNHKMTPPPFNQMIKTNKTLSELVNDKVFKKQEFTIRTKELV
jgi:hypothetical protein